MIDIDVTAKAILSSKTCYIKKKKSFLYALQELPYKQQYIFTSSILWESLRIYFVVFEIRWLVSVMLGSARALLLLGLLV